MPKCVFKCVCPFKATRAAFQTPWKGPRFGISINLTQPGAGVTVWMQMRRQDAELLRWTETLLTSLPKTCPL